MYSLQPHKLWPQVWHVEVNGSSDRQCVGELIHTHPKTCSSLVPCSAGLLTKKQLKADFDRIDPGTDMSHIHFQYSPPQPIHFLAVGS